jgi:hypothetical protein
MMQKPGQIPISKKKSWSASCRWHITGDMSDSADHRTYTSENWCKYYVRFGEIVPEENRTHDDSTAAAPAQRNEKSYPLCLECMIHWHLGFELPKSVIQSFGVLHISRFSLPPHHQWPTNCTQTPCNSATIYFTFQCRVYRLEEFPGMAVSSKFLTRSLICWNICFRY